MTLNQLKYIIAISKENSLNDAAKKPGPWWSNTTY